MGYSVRNPYIPWKSSPSSSCMGMTIDRVKYKTGQCFWIRFSFSEETVTRALSAPADIK